MAKVILVDENDTIIGYEERAEITREKRHRITAAWILNEQGEILMAQRSLQKSTSPGKWGPAAAGTVEERESYEENIRKELTEELGITVNTLRLGPKTNLTGHNPRMCQWFIGTIPKNTQLTLEPTEVAQAKWFTRSELQKMFANEPTAFTTHSAIYLPLLLEEAR